MKYTTVYHGSINPCIWNNKIGTDDANKLIGIFLKIQKTPIDNKNPKADAHIEYHNCCGTFKLPEGKNPTSKKFNPKKFAFPSAKVLGLPDPHHLPIKSVVWGVKIVEPDAVEEVIVDAKTVIPACDLSKK